MVLTEIWGGAQKQTIHITVYEQFKLHFIEFIQRIWITAMTYAFNSPLNEPTTCNRSKCHVIISENSDKMKSRYFPVENLHTHCNSTELKVSYLNFKFLPHKNVALTAYNSMVRRNFCGLSKQENFLYLIELIYDKVFDCLIASCWFIYFSHWTKVLKRILFAFYCNWSGFFLLRKLNRMVTQNQNTKSFVQNVRCSRLNTRFASSNLVVNFVVVVVAAFVWHVIHGLG